MIRFGQEHISKGEGRGLEPLFSRIARASHGLRARQTALFPPSRPKHAADRSKAPREQAASHIAASKRSARGKRRSLGGISTRPAAPKAPLPRLGALLSHAFRLCRAAARDTAVRLKRRAASIHPLGALRSRLGRFPTAVGRFQMIWIAQGALLAVLSSSRLMSALSPFAVACFAAALDCGCTMFHVRPPVSWSAPPVFAVVKR